MGKIVNHSKLVLVAISALLVGCQSSSQTPQTLEISDHTKHSIVLDNNERVCNLSGTWDAIYKQVDGFNEDIVEITQEGAEFLGIKTIGSAYVPKGSETIKGSLNRNGFKTIQVKTGNGWRTAISSQMSDCNQFVIKIQNSKLTLTRQ